MEELPTRVSLFKEKLPTLRITCYHFSITLFIEKLSTLRVVILFIEELRSLRVIQRLAAVVVTLRVGSSSMKKVTLEW